MRTREILSRRLVVFKSREKVKALARIVIPRVLMFGMLANLPDGNVDSFLYQKVVVSESPIVSGLARESRQVIHEDEITFLRVVPFSDEMASQDPSNTPVLAILKSFQERKEQALLVIDELKEPPPILGLAVKDEVPMGLLSGYLLPSLHRERNPSEAENSSHSSMGLHPGFSAKGDKQMEIDDIKVAGAQVPPNFLDVQEVDVRREIEVLKKAERSRSADIKKKIDIEEQAFWTLGLHVPWEIKRYEDIIVNAARVHNVNPKLIAAVINTESHGKPNAKSGMGAIGLMQVMGGSFDPEENINQGTKMLAYNLKRYGRLDLALAAYNAGVGSVDEARGVPNFPETLKHLERTMAYYNLYLQG